MSLVEEIYAAGEAAGLLTTVLVDGRPVAMDFRAPDEAVYDGMVGSTYYNVRYPSSSADLRQGDFIEIAGETYKVLDVNAIADGSEMRASLGKT